MKDNELWLKYWPSNIWPYRERFTLDVGSTDRHWQSGIMVLLASCVEHVVESELVCKLYDILIWNWSKPVPNG
jgi:hypothetical protein